MDLAVKNNNESPIALALKSETISEQHIEDVADMLSQTYFTAGQKIDTPDLVALAGALYAEVKEYFPFLKIGELRIALQAGVRGSYGEYYGLNIKSIHGWIKAYQVSEVRSQKLRELKKEIKPPKVDKEKVRRDYWEHVLKQVKNFKETGKIDISIPRLMATEFWHNQLLRPTKDEMEEYKQKAVYELEKRKDAVQKALSKKEYQEFQALSALIEGFNAGQVTEQQDALIKSKAAELCLLDYFKKISIEEFEERVAAILNNPF
jgi:hypothetical protein